MEAFISDSVIEQNIEGTKRCVFDFINLADILP